MFLFFDTETTGLPNDWKAPITQLDNWPRLVQIAWLLYDDKHQLTATNTFIIKPAGFTIPKAATKIHGITTAMAKTQGCDLVQVLNHIVGDINQAKQIIAHNIAFDEKILGAELIRNQLPNVLEKKAKICTMHNTTDFCKIPGRYGKYKWPSLSALHTKVFGHDFENAHDALSDIKATANCFWELHRQGVL